MKILIYIPADDAVKGKLDPENYSTCDPDNSKWVQVSITPDEFARLEDTDEEAVITSRDDYKGPIGDQMEFPSDFSLPRTPYDKAPWLIEQYNRNRDPEDHIKNINEIK